MAIIGIDCDGTIMTHRFPLIGEDIGAIPVLKELVANGHYLVLWTLRGYSLLEEAVDWCDERGIHFWGINQNPEQHEWTDSPKAYCNCFIDDAALGCPLIYPENGERAYVDWTAVRTQLVSMGYLQ